jgi:acetyl esterase
MSHRLIRRTRAGVAIVALGIVGILLGGCAVTATSHVGTHVSTHAITRARKPVIRAGVAAASSVRVIDNVQFGEADGEPLQLDLCVPERAVTPSVARRPAVILVHGGSWTHGDKSEWLGICQWMAADGFVAASIGYRLAPAHVFPAGVDDLETAVRWLKSPAQVAAYAINPDRIGAFGGSAGGNLVSLLGVSGSGPVDLGDRVEAVAELSGPIDLTSNGLELTDFYPYELSYLGCASYADCPQAVAASPIFHVSPTDPPFFVAQSTDERIPLVQSQRFVAALRKAGVPTTFMTRPGDRHSVAILDPQLRQDILDFFTKTLGDPSLVTP